MQQLNIKSKDIQFIDIDKLIPCENNPNIHSDKQIELLCKLITYQGFRVPLIVDKETNTIASGHGRYEAAKKLGYEKLPVVFQEFDNYDQFYAFMVSDNAVSELAELDKSMINLEIPNLGPDFDIEALGIPDFTIEPMDNDLWNLNKKPIICPHCGKEI